MATQTFLLKKTTVRPGDIVKFVYPTDVMQLPRRWQSQFAHSAGPFLVISMVQKKYTAWLQVVCEAGVGWVKITGDNMMDGVSYFSDGHHHKEAFDDDAR